MPSPRRLASVGFVCLALSFPIGGCVEELAHEAAHDLASDAASLRPDSVDGGALPEADAEAASTMSADGGPPKPQPRATKRLAVLTGKSTSSGKFGVGGTDLGIPVRQPRNTKANKDYQALEFVTGIDVDGRAMHP